MAFQPANLALDGGDPRDAYVAGDKGYDVAALHLYNDPTIIFEEYYHYAQITRAEEHRDAVANKQPFTLKGMLKNRFSKNKNGVTSGTVTPPQRPSDYNTGNVSDELVGDEKKIATHDRASSEAATIQQGSIHDTKRRSDMMRVTDGEWKQASRAIRTASWSACFYLVTTDILGPFSVPWAFAQMGYGPGVALYTVFAAMASLSGYYIWKVFLDLDSDRYPLRDYGMAFLRIFGSTTRHAVNVLQAIQMILTVSALILSNGQAISQVSQVTTDNPVCFVVCLLIFTLIGMVMGQIRTLQRFGWLANFAIWINVLVLIFTMAIVARSGPYYTAVMNAYATLDFSLPIMTFAGTPPAGLASGGDGFIGSLNGLNQAVYSYGGAMLFFSFMAEMRHPWDFWKAMVCANVFIYVCYMFFGIFVYSFQGQYTYNPANQGIGDAGWRTATNIMNIVTGLIAACLYGNIGIKVIYTNVLQELCGFPPLNAKAGKWIWVALVPIYWALAFIVAAAIPQFSYITGLIGAVCILSFTYTFPALLALGYFIQKDAMLPEESFNVATGRYQRVDKGFKRWARGYMVKWHLNTFNLLYFLGALATCALGIYSSVEGLITAFGGGSVATSFSCASPA